MQSTTLIVIVAMSVDTENAVLYKEDGSTITIKQGDARLPRILAQAKPFLGVGRPATVDLEEVVTTKERLEYKDVEDGTKGVIKFFKVAKSFLKKLVNTESPEEVAVEVAHITPVTLGMLPVPVKEDKKQPEKKITLVVPEPTTLVLDADNKPTGKLEVSEPLPEEGTVAFVKLERDEPRKEAVIELAQTLKAVAEKKSLDPVDVVNGDVKPTTNTEKVAAATAKMDAIMVSGKSTSDPEFHGELNEADTIVAVNTKTGAILPDVQKISHQLKAFTKLKDYAGFTNFMNRLSGIIDQRGHSVEDLMKFMETGDLPIADDGCIVIYKRLNNRENGRMVDCHSGRINQSVGSFVFMRQGLVDPNRRQDCSNGLHVASLSYISGFSGNATVIAKVRPEDVFAVPEYNNNKMRVCGYHILVRLEDRLRRLVNSGGSISSDEEGAIILNKVLRGEHVPVLEHVEVTEQNGHGVKYTKIADLPANPEFLMTDTPVKNTTLVLEKDEGQPVPSAPPVKAAELVVEKPVEEEKKMSTKDLAKKRLAELKKAKTPEQKATIATDLVALKTRTKKSWPALGFKEADISLVLGSISTGNNNVKAEAIQEKAKKAVAKRESGKPVKETPRTIIREMLDKGNLSKAEYGAIILLKRKAKKSWELLGVNPVEVAAIELGSK